MSDSNWLDVSGCDGLSAKFVARPILQRNGCDASEPESGFDSGDLTVTLSRHSENTILAHGSRKLKRLCGNNSSYYMRVSAALNIHSYSPAIHVLFPLQEFTIIATGGDGGDGARGSDGADGRAGKDGTAAKRMTTRASDGQLGESGGHAGSASSGAKGGAGGFVQVRVCELDMDLMGLVKVNAAGGCGGQSGGDNGRAGIGGLGGRGGAGVHWVDRWGWKKMTGSLPAGADGSSGAPGDESLRVAEGGSKGIPGKISFIVQYSAGQQIEYDSPFDLRVESFQTSNPNREACDRWEPHDMILVSKIVVKNHGTMPTPRHTAFTVSLCTGGSSSSWFLETNSLQAAVPTYILPGESLKLHSELYLIVRQRFEIGSFMPWRNQQILYLQASLFEQQKATLSSCQQSVTLANAIELDEFVACDSMHVGETTLWSCYIRNCTSYIFTRHVIVKLFPCESSSSIVLLDSEADWNSECAGLKKQWKKLEPGESIQLRAMVKLQADAPIFQTQSFLVELWIEDSEDHQLHCAQRYKQSIRACPTVDVSVGTDVLLVGDEFTTHYCICDWISLLSKLGLRYATIDATMERGIPWKQLEKRNSSGPRTIIILQGCSRLTLGEPHMLRRMMRKHDFRLLIIRKDLNQAELVADEIKNLLFGTDSAEMPRKMWDSAPAFWKSLQAVEHGTSAAEARVPSLTPEFYCMQEHILQTQDYDGDVAWLTRQFRYNFPYRSFKIEQSLESKKMCVWFGLDLGVKRWMVAYDASPLSPISNRIAPVISSLTFKRKLELWKDLSCQSQHSHELFCLSECLIMDLVVEQAALMNQSAIVLESCDWRRRLSFLDELQAAVEQDRGCFAQGMFRSTLIRILAWLCEISSKAVNLIDYVKHLSDPQSCICIRSAVQIVCSDIIICVTGQVVGPIREQIHSEIREQRHVISRGKVMPQARDFIQHVLTKYSLLL